MALSLGGVREAQGQRGLEGQLLYGLVTAVMAPICRLAMPTVALGDMRVFPQDSSDQDLHCPTIRQEYIMIKDRRKKKQTAPSM